MLPHSPFLQPHKTFNGLGLAARFQFHNINTTAAALFGPIQRERFWHSADVDVLEIPVVTNEIKDDAPGAKVAKPLQLGIFGMVSGLVENRVEKKFTFLEASARQPFDLHEKLRTESAQNLLRLRFIAVEERGRQDSLG